MKKYLSLAKDIYHSPRGKAIYFFAFYFFFFLFLMIFLRIGDKSIYSSSDYEEGSSIYYDQNQLISENYSYKYRVVLDGVSSLYEGKRNKSRDVFQYLNKSYYVENDIPIGSKLICSEDIFQNILYGRETWLFNLSKHDKMS